MFQRTSERISAQVAEAAARPEYAQPTAKALSERLRRDLAKGERFALAVLDDRAATALGSGSRVVYISDDTLIKQAVHRAGQALPQDAYARVQRAIDTAEWGGGRHRP